MPGVSTKKFLSLIPDSASKHLQSMLYYLHMKKSLSSLLVTLLVTAQLSLSFPILAAEFNPNFIISDEELQNWRSMSRADIQSFLESNKSYLSEYKTVDIDGEKRFASDIIYRASKEHQINPKYLLVKFQKEQSLTLDRDPTQYQLDWAAGYAVCDSCSINDPKVQKFKGFAKQTDNAASVMRWYYDNVDSVGYIKKPGITYSISGTEVTPANKATAFMYTYTPHLNGNKNFWKIWQSWFDQVYPDGTLVKAADSHDIYLIQNGKKRLFSSMSALTTRYDPKLVVVAPASELARYETGSPISLPNFSILKQGSTYYLLDYDILRKFADGAIQKFGYHPDEIIEVSSNDIADYPISSTIIEPSQSAPLGRLVKIKETGQTYYIFGNTFHPILDPQIININFSHLTVETEPATYLQTLRKGPMVLFKDGTLLGTTGDNQIFVIENGKKRHITNEEVFLGLGWKWENIVWTSPVVGLAFPYGESIYLRAAPTPNNTAEQADAETPETTEPTGDEPTSEKPTIAELMVRTPADKQSTVGPTFSTDVDAYLVAEYDTEKILAGKNIDFPRPLASLSKMMTAYQVVAEGFLPQKVVTYDPTQHKATYHYYKITSGEKVTANDLMYAVLVSSLNTPSRMLVDAFEPNEADFIARMNKQATAWGLTNTKFYDVSGLDERNVGTVKEYLTLFKKTVRNSIINPIISTKTYSYDEVLDLDQYVTHKGNHTNKLLFKTGLPYTIEASKTGYLYESGDNLAMVVKRNSDGKRFIVITMGNPDRANRFAEPDRLTRWALSNF